MDICKYGRSRVDWVFIEPCKQKIGVSMKSLIGFCFTFVFALMLVATPRTQQEQEGYVVKIGETLWGIAEKNFNAGLAWEVIVRKNDFLQEPGRHSIDEKGRTIIKIYPGEVLQGVNKVGDVYIDLPNSFTPDPAPTTESVRESRNIFTEWMFWLFILAVIFFWMLWMYKRKGTEWRPMVEGGARTDEQVRSILERQASDMGATLIQGSQTKVRLSGVWGTQHRGIPVPVPHRYDQVRAWRARFRMPNMTEREGFMLQECGNDITYHGAWYVPLAGVRVEEGWGENEGVVTHPIVAPAANEPTTEQDHFVEGVVKFEFRSAHGEQPAMVRLTGVDEKSNNTIEVREGEITVRFTSRSKDVK